MSGAGRMLEIACACFDTALGACAVAWHAAGPRAAWLVGVQLPEASADATRLRLQQRFGGAEVASPPPPVADAIARIRQLLAGGRDDLLTVALDDSAVPPFHQRAYEVARRIAPGTTLTYGEVAARLGQPNASRAVGQAMGANPFPVVVPCHRVLAAGGRAGGFSGHGGTRTKLRLLEIEGAPLGGSPGLFD